MTVFSRLFRRTPAVPPAPMAIPPAEPLTPPPLKLSQSALDALSTGPRQAPSPFGGLPKPPPGVRPSTHPWQAGMAMDDAAGVNISQTYGTWAVSGMWGEGLFFPGYPYLAELAQRPEYRNMSETIAEQMTRKWIKLKSTGDKDKSDEIRTLDDAMKRYSLREAFQHAAELDGLMGMALIYIDTGSTDDPDELATPLLIDTGKVEKGSLRGFVVVEPTWVSPAAYNSTDPLRPDFYEPYLWYIMGKQVHASRLLIVRSREVPDILKASYNFGGVSLSQLAKPYVDNWIRTRQSVSDLLHAFTVFTLKTNLSALFGDAGAMLSRITAFVLGRDNKGLMMVDKETEDLTNTSAPLGSLDHLQAQAQEQLASVSQQPLVWLLGITPSGLNTSAEGEIRVFYDRIRAKQEKAFGEPLTRALKVLQLSEFGKIDPEIEYDFNPLWELDAAGRAAVEKMKADTDAVYMTEAVVSNEEVRTRLAADPDSPYHGLEGPAPEPPEMEDIDLKDDAEKIAARGAEGSESGANSGV